VRVTLTNTKNSPRGVFDAHGEVHVVNPGQSLEVELSEQEAAELMRGGGAFRVTRHKVEIREAVQEQPQEKPKRGRPKKGAAPAG
jgi:hypothetical protein